MRDTDRWITPRVVVALIAGAVLVVLAALAAVTYLAARGIDPAPVLKVAGAVGAGVSGVLSLLVQLVNRKTITKVEREAGRTASALYDVADIIDQRTTRRAPAPPVPSRHAYPETGATPAVRGS